MRRVAALHNAFRFLALILAGAIFLQWAMGSVFASSAIASSLNLPGQAGRIYLPLVLANYVPPEGRLCRFGVGAPPNIASYPVNALRIGWYTDWGSSLKPARPGGITYLQMIHLAQTGPDTYTSNPSGSALMAMIAANPGASWVIGNEPDRRYVQDDLEPQAYAVAYHDLYHQIKGADPTARIAAGGIVQPTPLRLRYLDLILDNYRARYGVEMPVDVWNIHAYPLNEQSCNAACPGYNNCWGAEIPPGMSDCTGVTYDYDVYLRTIVTNINVFKQFIVDFRQWMAQHNYQDRPLIITEFGVLMPPNDVAQSRVIDFMNAAFDYLSTAADASGYSADKNRLVQAWAWYSLTDNVNYNGWLFDPATKARSVYGDNFAAYTAHVIPYVNLTPWKVRLDSTQTPVELVASVSNNGNIELLAPTVVRFYDGDPENGGVQIGSDQLLPPLNGCANIASVRTTWTNATPGTATIWVVVDPGNTVRESDEADNRLWASVGIPF